MYYLIKQTLEACTERQIRESGEQYVALLTWEEWKQTCDSFDMGIDLDLDMTNIFTTKAEVNYDSLTGSFSIPDRNDLTGEDQTFAFALDEKGVVFIDDSGTAAKYLQAIHRTRKWRLPGLERFLYDFLDQITKDDLRLMERYERELEAMEQDILSGDAELSSERLNQVRGDIRELRIHYDQLIDLGQELEENENNFFDQENLRYFRLFLNRLARLHDTAASLRDYTMQLQDLYQAQLDIRQNRIMTVLTVVTTIFLPLTLIAGWYGMNFKYMPELNWRWSYLVVILVSAAIVVGSLWFFKKKKWL